MEHNWVLYIAAFSTAFAVSNVFTPIAKTISMKVGAIDYPKARGMHQKPMPRMGGLAIVIGFMFTVLLLYRFVEFGETRKLIGFMIGATMIVVACYKGSYISQRAYNAFMDSWRYKRSKPYRRS